MAGGLDTAGRTGSDHSLIAVKADLYHIAAPVKSGEHYVAGDFSTGNADMQAGIA
jgi:hypothetical protein